MAPTDPERIYGVSLASWEKNLVVIFVYWEKKKSWGILFNHHDGNLEFCLCRETGVMFRISLGFLF